MSTEKRINAPSGWVMLFVTIVAYLASCGLLVAAIIALGSASSAVPGGLLMFAYVVVLTFAIIASCGFFTLQPGQARVCVLFGDYKGTVRDEGFRWANPFYSRNLGVASDNTEQAPVELSASGIKLGGGTQRGHGSKISTRARTYNGDRIKVNDKMGNPIEIATVVVWRVVDTAKAVFDVDDYESYVYTVTETALRHVASLYSYDHMEDDDDLANTITLRTNIEEVSEALRVELDRRLEIAGVDVVDARLTHLAYAPEIAQAMLRRGRQHRPRRRAQGRHGLQPHGRPLRRLRGPARPQYRLALQLGGSQMAARKQYPLRIDPEIWAAVERWAADEMRSSNAQMEWILRDALRRAGRLPKNGRPAGDEPGDES